MIVNEKQLIRVVEELGTISEGVRFIAIIMLIIFLISSMITLLVGEENIPVKSYLAYIVVYFIYRISLV